MKFIFSVVLFFVASSFSATTIDPIKPYAYSANAGWINAVGDTDNGAVIGQVACSGYLYSANCGWIHLGSGMPEDGVAYGNSSATDYGVNHDGCGNLSGYAYSANVGWINFEQTYGQPKVNLMTGDVWGANVGWIGLDSGKYGVCTLTLDSGPDDDADGIPDLWEYNTYGTSAGLTATGDYDGDGVSDRDEYLADTNPMSDTDYPTVIDFQVMGTTNQVTWPVKATRRYTLEHTVSLCSCTRWMEDANFIPASGADWVEMIPDVTNATRFYRIKAAPPLSE